MIPRVKSRLHKDFIRQCPCLICGENTTVECAHVRYSEPKAAKVESGMGFRPSDVFVVPLCGRCHRDQHQNGERKWWAIKGIDPVYAALALSNVSGDHEAAVQIIAAWQAQARRAAA